MGHSFIISHLCFILPSAGYSTGHLMEGSRHGGVAKPKTIGKIHWIRVKSNSKPLDRRRFQHTPGVFIPDPEPPVYEGNPFILDFFHIWGMFQEISNERPHGPRTPKKPEYLLGGSQLTKWGPLGFGPVQFLMESNDQNNHIISLTFYGYSTSNSICVTSMDIGFNPCKA